MKVIFEIYNCIIISITREFPVFKRARKEHQDDKPKISHTRSENRYPRENSMEHLPHLKYLESLSFGEELAEG